jgi:hypothetical protein
MPDPLFFFVAALLIFALLVWLPRSGEPPTDEPTLDTRGPDDR